MIKKIVSLMFTGIICFGLVISANAQTFDGIQERESVVQSGSYETRATVIVRKYRILNGVRQYRRWNETFGYWVDPYWINLV